MAFSHKTIVMMHLEKRFHLRHGIEIDTNQDEQRSAAQQIRQLAREIKEPLHEGRKKCDKSKEQRSG